MAGRKTSGHEKKPKEGQIIFCVDEAGVGLLPSLGKTHALKGKTPLLIHKCRYKSLFAFWCLSRDAVGVWLPEIRNVSEITYAFGRRILGAGCVSEIVT